jgi:hypothetical protein
MSSVWNDKLILAIRNVQGRGKSASIRSFADNLVGQPHRLILDKGYSAGTGDFRLVIEVTGKVVAVESMGDPNSNFSARIQELIIGYFDKDTNTNIPACHILVTATRTSGETWYAVDAYKHTHDIIWDSTYMSDKSTANQKDLNTIKGKHIYELVKIVGVI